ncbi:hypothetical protein DNC80_01755 [Flavobacterium sp. SOK18b]|uniref:energy transducer TonB n=1 Tax=Flavobacterium sp. SOK18b TaxID=797900 RepID=UPI0015FD4A82|nr:energy transducer TonB [Flavobacterium sp. SOK18b]MBB1192391.1 hypothetical protein [Flavobacterium sp. SOK18b]
MKNFLILILMCFAQNVFSQTLPKVDPISSNIEAPISSIITYSDDNADNMVYDKSAVEIKPEFPGGQQKLDLFINQNYNLTDPLASKGKIYVTFTIEKDGSLTNIKLLRDFGYGSGEEVIRILKTAPKWIPAKQNGKNLRVKNAIMILIE